MYLRKNTTSPRVSFKLVQKPDTNASRDPFKLCSSKIKQNGRKDSFKLLKKTDTKGSRDSFKLCTYFTNKTQETSDFRSNYLKNKTRDPLDSFKLL